ncbi:hypothetical protein [Rhodovulum visakhapatnamense]|uniref:Uncharacterized protein n=1 Tax=Rhodovulum visakhapatnamense TaxID=364297 RepID=A0A4V3GS13_9RHOB|nr:hypothetical protein [Rhodovulum visakhapatnamense]TDX21113.1 hypothetical protein EV657_1469 [Rhodovulum visakhapatnamense]
MFKNLQQELEKLGRMKEISVPIEPDSEGYLDKECPSEPCLFLFKVHGDDWSNIVRDEEVFCPSCGHVAPKKSWYPRAQLEAARDYALGTIANSMNKAMRADAAASKRRQNRNSFLSITLDVKGGRDTVLVPVAAAEPMRLRTSCESCGCRYSYVGAAYFCPSCGENSASHTFTQTLNTIRTAAGLGEILRNTLGPDEAEVMIRTLLEKAIQDTVMSFQRLNEQLYKRQSGKTARRNAFQKLDAGSDLWKAEIGHAYVDLIGQAKLDQLKIYFQQRHLLAHQQGIVDQDYIDRSGDKTYAVGQRLIVRERSAQKFADLVEELGDELRQRVEAKSG